jgi:hypothetical protein
MNNDNPYDPYERVMHKKYPLKPGAKIPWRQRPYDEADAVIGIILSVIALICSAISLCISFYGYCW